MGLEKREAALPERESRTALHGELIYEASSPSHKSGADASGEFAPSNGAAIDFLKSVRPAAPWALSAINPQSGTIETKTFSPNDTLGCGSWLAPRNGRVNLYWQINETGPLTKKAKKADIKSVHFLHVDIDPRTGEDFDAERERIFGLLTDKLPEGAPPPSFIIDSGNGFQALWKLEEPIVVDGDEGKAAEVERRTRWLEAAFGADACHNVDRLFRLPGTMNIPNEKKLKAGRTARLASLVSCDVDRVFPFEGFKQAPAINGAAGAPSVAVDTASVKRLTGVDDLPPSVPDWVKVAIVHGFNPDEPNKYPSRSHALFAVCCALVRAGVDDETHYSVITDPDFKISASVLEVKSYERYALRQIEQAHEAAISPHLAALNDKFWVAKLNGKPRVFSEEDDATLGRVKLVVQTFEDFRNFFCNQLVDTGATNKDGEPIYRPKGDWWLKHPTRRTYERTVFAPGQDIPNAYNLWKGFAVEAREGDAHRAFLCHIHDNICAGDETNYQYLMNWMARAIQQPGRPGETAIVLRGRQGVGKSVFASQFGRLFGRHFLHVTNAKHLAGSFNAHLRDCIVLFGDEAFDVRDKGQASLLKTTITERIFMIEAKGIDAEAAANCTHIILASNDLKVINAAEDERRFFVLNVSDTRANDIKYFAEIVRAMENGGDASLLHYLLSIDLTDFEVRRPPVTEALKEQKLLSADGWMSAILDMASTGVTPDHDMWKPFDQRSERRADWVSVAAILEAAGLDPNNRALQMAVAATLKPLCQNSIRSECTCICDLGKPPLPITLGDKSTLPIRLDIRRVQRRMHELRPLGEVRAALAAYGASWDEGVIGWTLRGDE